MAATETTFSLTNTMSFWTLLNPFTSSFDDTATFDLENLICIEQVEEHCLQVTFLLTNEATFTFDTNFTDIDEPTIKKAITNLFEFISYDIDKLEEISEQGSLGTLLIQYIK